MLGQMGIDLAELYSKTTDFDLIISSTYDISMSEVSYVALFHWRSYRCTPRCRLRCIFQGPPSGTIDPEALYSIPSKAPCHLALQS